MCIDFVVDGALESVLVRGYVSAKRHNQGFNMLLEAE